MTVALRMGVASYRSVSFGIVGCCGVCCLTIFVLGTGPIRFTVFFLAEPLRRQGFDVKRSLTKRTFGSSDRLDYAACCL